MLTSNVTVLPTYPFERQRYWIEEAGEPSQGEIKLAKRSNITDWFYVPSWKRVPGRNATCHVRQLSHAIWFCR